MTKTRILVVMPIYNAEVFVRQAITSILTQSYSDFQLLLVNDGSTDQSSEVIHSFSDTRIKTIDQRNLGPGVVMNNAIQFAAENKFEFLARMDADDISLPDRFEKQVNLLQRNHNSAACSANCYYIDSETEEIIGTSTVSTSKKLIRWELTHGLRGLVQGATIFRTSALYEVGGYRSAFKKAEEVDLFLRLSENYDFVNSPEYLYKIRLNPNSLSLKDVHANILYQFYALNCASQRKRGLEELEFDHFQVNQSFYTRFKIWREENLLKLWRRGFSKQYPFLKIYAALLDPRRVFIRFLRWFLSLTQIY